MFAWCTEERSILYTKALIRELLDAITGTDPTGLLGLAGRSLYAPRLQVLQQLLLALPVMRCKLNWVHALREGIRSRCGLGKRCKGR